METLRTISVFWSMLHVIVIFLMLFRSRYAAKKTMVLGAVCLGALMILNGLGMIFLGAEAMGQFLLFTCTIPSFVFFYFLSEDKSAAYLFTFCLVDTVCYWILCVTNLLNYYLSGGNFILMFITRLLAFPLLEYLICKYLRTFYINLQRIVKKGWGAYAGMTALYYMLLFVMFEFPTRITDRPDHIPAFILVLLLMVLNYMVIFYSLQSQYEIYEREKHERVLQEQKMSLETQLDNQQRIRKLRHDMRGHTITLQGLLQAGKEKEALEYLETMGRSIDAAQSQICADPYLNAQLTHYMQKFRELGITLNTDIRLGNGPLPHMEVCSIISNALENAWEESKTLPPEMASAAVQMKYSKDYLVIRLRNRCHDALHVARGTIPATGKAGRDHGLGLLSIKEMAEALDGSMVCYTDNGHFVLDVMLRINDSAK